ncbi:MAG: AraC family transcriptional regulator [Lysobacterales bacterium]
MSNCSARREATVRVGPMVNISSLLLKLGCDPDPVFERAGLRRDEFSDLEHRVSYSKCGQLLAECAAVTQCGHFGLLLGQMAGPSHLGVVGFLARSASTVGQALNTLVKNLDLHDEGASCSLLVEDEYCRLSYSVHQPTVSGLDQICDLSTVLMYGTMRLLCGREWNATQVLMVKSRPPETAPYSRFFRSAVLFDSDTCGIVFPVQDLGLSPPTADRLLFHHLELEADTLHRAHNSEIRAIMPAVLQQGLLLNRYSAGDIADALKLRERTLHRRLKSAGTNFRLELDAVRESFSKQLLESSNRPIGDIAASVGYADSSCFVRAFHRWAGISPAAWRKQQGAASAR